MRQLAPVKRPDKNKREGRGSTDGGEEVWPFSLSTLLLICIETCIYSSHGVGAHRQLIALGQVTRERV